MAETDALSAGSISTVASFSLRAPPSASASAMPVSTIRSVIVSATAVTVAAIRPERVRVARLHSRLIEKPTSAFQRPRRVPSVSSAIRNHLSIAERYHPISDGQCLVIV